ncbi:uncharacterized protein UTRI_01627 [Ustilago trichophora]|uniref:Uncharacterized protein n=1 Tax=Ustilago trichophora TaxID=86804 RepID=A0A5C3E0N0_9BASI|nr:uncharacterized protein UTRI_01627 [Ustilago trichophora]
MVHSTEHGSEPIKFRAALATFEQNSYSSSSSQPRTLHSPKPRPLPPTTRQPPQTPARSSSGSEPVPRSSSTPRIRKNSDGLMPPFTNNPFFSSTHTPSSIPTTSASGMLSAPSPTFPASVSPVIATASTPLRNSGSGLSLHELTDKSLPRGSGNGTTASPLLRSRSRSVAEDHDATTSGNSAPASGRSSPYLPPRTVIGLFGTQDESEAVRRTESPAGSQHMLDTSADDDMFAHAVMQRSSAPPSPDRKHAPDAFLPPPQVPSRKGSASSTNSVNASTPRLPPRPAGGNGSLAPSPTISEFGQFPSNATSATPKGKAALAYATYTPGAKRNVGGSNGGIDGSMTPPALPPRSATLGQADRGRAADAAYQARQRSPLKHAPTIPKKPSASKPAPPPRPTKTWEGNAGGFRFGSTNPPSEDSLHHQPQPPPPPRQRTHNRSLTNTSTGSNTHRKTGSTVFTSISLSDDASLELKRSLESDLHSDHHHHQQQQQQQQQQLPPPSRGRSVAYPPSNASSSSLATRSNATASGGTGPGGVVSSLIGTAASALPLFKSTSQFTSGGSRSLADGAPSKQQQQPYYSGGAAVSRSASAHSDLSVRPGEGSELWGGRGRVELADSTIVGKAKSANLKEPRDDIAKARYETLFEKLLVKQQSKRAKRKGAKVDKGASSNASTIKETPSGERKPSGGVQALRGWFESDSAPPSTIANSIPTSTPRTAPAESATNLSLSPSTVRKVWIRSHLPATFLAQVWDAAITSQSSSMAGLENEAFVRGMASIDAELERKKARRNARQERRKKLREAMGRRVPPPPPV